MNIGVDIDGTLNNFPDIFLRMGHYFTTNVLGRTAKPDKTEYDLRKCFDWSKTEFETFWDTFASYSFCVSDVRKGAIEILDALKKKNRIYLITARQELFLEATITWLVANYVPYDRLHVGIQDKAKFCKENNIKLMIEDKIKTCEEVSKVARVICFDNPYNQDYKGERIESWYFLRRKEYEHLF